jgi:large subunit ribosomal protein L7/L12
MLFLKSAGQAKLAIVKLVKELSGVSLKEAKEIVDAAPSSYQRRRFERRS